MANTLTGLIPVIQLAMNKVAREMVGFIPAVYRNVSAERAALNQTIRYAIAPAISLVQGAAAAYPADNGSATIGYADMTLTKDYYAPIMLEGEERLGLSNSGQAAEVMQQRFEQAIRALVNAIEADLATQYIYASRAVKTTGLALFDNTDKLASLAQLWRILADNGANGEELKLVLGNSATAALKSTDFLFKVNEAGTSDLLRDGKIGRLMGFDIHSSGQIAAHTNGDYTDSVVTALALAGTAITGTSLGGNLKGDLLKIANDDSNVYVLNADASATAGVINAPGSKVAHAAATDAVTPLIATSYTPNMAFAKNAIHLCVRAPAMPDGGDSADDARMIVDPLTGLGFEVRLYRGVRKVFIHVCAVWGWKTVKSDFVALLAE
jgi:hypothetical protein